MKIMRQLNWSRIKKSRVFRRNHYDIFKKVYWLEFENECILKFLTKYDIFMRGQDNYSDISKDTKIEDYVNLTHEPKFIIDVTVE
jgi:hypothetical protein